MRHLHCNHRYRLCKWCDTEERLHFKGTVMRLFELTKKKKLKKGEENPVQNNPVAKHARTFNKATVQRDRTKYKRKSKHKEY